MAMNIVINNLFGAAEDAYAPVEGDYIGEDGLWYCGKCHTVMQTKITLLGEKKTPFVPCRCRQEEIDAQEKERERYVREMELLHARELCFSNTMLWKWNFGSCDDRESPLMISMQNYCTNFRDLLNYGCGIALYGPVGVGKTFAAACVANELIEKGFSVHMTDFPRVINTLWDLKDGKQKYLDRLNDYDLLIIDDLAAERNTPYMNEIVMNVVDSRCKSGKAEIDEEVAGIHDVYEDDLDDYYNDLAEVWIKVDGLEELVHNHKAELFNTEKLIYKLSDDVKGIKIALAGVLSIQILLSAICFVKSSLTQKRGKVI